MIYADRILGELDQHLHEPVELTLYGRAAFLLGFENPPEQFSQSLDVDAVLWLGQAESLSETSNFWQAIEETNSTLAPEGLYISHLFVEDQVILTSDWLAQRAPISSSWSKLNLYRLSDEDLLLSKLMRDDPQDRQDALFIIGRRNWNRGDLDCIFERARIPDIAEIKEQFALASAKLRNAID